MPRDRVGEKYPAYSADSFTYARNRGAGGGQKSDLRLAIERLPVGKAIDTGIEPTRRGHTSLSSIAQNVRQATGRRFRVRKIHTDNGDSIAVERVE